MTAGYSVSASVGVGLDSPGGLDASSIIRASGAVEIIPSKIVTVLRPGDRVIVRTAGGAGWGPPPEHDPCALAADISNGKIGREAAPRDSWAAVLGSEDAS